MRRNLIITFVLLIGFAGMAFAEEYDQEHVVEVRRNNMMLMGEIGEAAAAEEWFQAAFKLFELAEGMYGLIMYEPPRGPEEDWQETLTEFVNTAFIGIGACGTRDAEALQASIDTLRQLNRQGHGDHKPRR